MPPKCNRQIPIGLFIAFCLGLSGAIGRAALLPLLRRLVFGAEMLGGTPFLTWFLRLVYYRLVPPANECDTAGQSNKLGGELGLLTGCAGRYRF